MLKLILNMVVFLSVFSTLSYAEEIIWFDATIYSNGSAALNDIKYTSASSMPEGGEGEYSVRLFSANNTILYTRNFTAAFFAYAEGYRDGKITGINVNLDSVRNIFSLPYFKDAGRVGLYRDSTLLLEAEVPTAYKDPKKPEDFYNNPLDDTGLGKCISYKFQYPMDCIVTPLFVYLWFITYPIIILLLGVAYWLFKRFKRKK
ncbi:MAG TPA: hypothetical protein VJH90_03340 [archaeon]|nr:hypothetical protein [archaeon]